MEVHILDNLTNKAKSSLQTLQEQPLKYFVRAMMAGAFLGFALIFCFTSVNALYKTGSPLTGFLAALLFGVALLMIVYGGGELFTGTTMYYVISSMRKETTWKQTILVWIICIIGNLAGGIVFAFLMSQTGIIQDMGMDNWLFAIAEGKISNTTTEIFFRGILCNWMVCMAIFLPKAFKNDFAQIFTLQLIVAVFFASGFEHVVANLALFSLALFVPHPETITIMGAIHNIIPAFFGNIVGGGFFMGFLYTWLNFGGRK